MIVPALCVMLTPVFASACASSGSTDAVNSTSAEQKTTAQTPANVERRAAGKETRTAPVGVGDAAPDFSLASHKGGEVRLSDARGASPVVLVFYRGHW